MYQAFPIKILTLFPAFFDSFKQYSLIHKAIQSGLISLECIDIRDYSHDKHKKCDDLTYGGGSGMLMTAQPIRDAIAGNKRDGDLILALTARGLLWQQQLVRYFVQRLFSSSTGKVADESEHGYQHLNHGRNIVVPEAVNHMQPAMSKDQLQISEFWKKRIPETPLRGLLLLCGHYEGMDQRVLDLDTHLEVTIGDYILSGGETAALVVIESLLRYLPGFMGNAESLGEESFELRPKDQGENAEEGVLAKLLEYPQYTRPAEFEGVKVPEVLLSGHHENIEKWRRQMRMSETRIRRPDLLPKEPE